MNPVENDMRLNTYLSFNGDCRQALEFYARHLGGQVSAMQTFGDTPGCDQLPAEARDLIMHGRLDVGAYTIMGTDATPDHPYTPIQGSHLVADVDTPEQAEALFAAFSEGGQVELPLQPMFWARRYAILTDRHGVRWMINCT